MLTAGEGVVVRPAEPRDGFTEADLRRIPGSRGVVILEADDGRAVLVAVTGEARRFCQSRLGAQAGAADASAGPDVEPRAVGAGDRGAAARGARPSADLRPVTARVVVHPCRSLAMAEVLFLDVARSRLPRVARLAAERRRGWFVRWNAADPTPMWRKTNLSDVPPGSTDGSDLLGPFGTKDAGGRFAEGLDELFELCRYPRELEKAPRGKACAYKEMGKCPAACDGSEPMDAYRARVHDAVALTREGVAHAIERTNTALRSASSAMNFEHAGMLKARLDRLGVMRKAPMRHARTLDRFAAIVAGAGERGVHLMLCARGWVHDLGEMDAEGDCADIAQAAATHAAASPAFDGDPRRVDAVGLFAHWVYAPATARTRAVMLDGHDDAGVIGELVRAIARHRNEDDDAGASGEMELSDA